MRVQAFRSVLIVGTLAGASLACQAISSLGGDAAILKDDFSKSDSGWGTGTDDESSVEYVSGGLHFKIFKPNFFTWSNTGQDEYENVHMEVTVSNNTGDTRAGMGLMCNQQSVSNSYYYFAITSVGEYVIGKSALGQDDVFLTNNDDWAVSDQITKNAGSYRIGADCKGGDLTLYVDGKKIDSASDSDYTNGQVGLFLWSGDDPAGEVTYDDFVMTALK